MEAFLIITLGALATCVPFYLGQRYGFLRLVSPMHLLSYFCCFGFLMKVIAYAIWPDFAFYATHVSGTSAGTVGAIYLFLFIMLICLGYRMACAPFDRNDVVIGARLIARDLRYVTTLFVISYAVTCVTIIFLIQARGAQGLSLDLFAGVNSAKQINVNAQGVGSTLAGIKTLFVVAKFAFIILLAHALVTGRVAAQIMAVLLGILLCFVALMSGDRFELVELCIFALITHVIVGGRMTSKGIGLAAITLCCCTALSVYMTQLRGADQGLVRQIIGSTYFLDINAAVMVTDRVTPATLLWGQSYGWWTFGWMPRAWWFDKPAIDLGVYFKRDVLGIYTGGAFNVTGPGEAFINFSWAGLGVGFILGWIYRKGEAFLLSPARTLRWGSGYLYPILFYPFVQGTLQSSFSAFIVGAAAQMLLIALLIAFFVTRYRPVYGGRYA